MKTCTKCGIEKDESEFYKSNKVGDGLQTACIICQKKYNKINKEKISTKSRIYREEHKEEIVLNKKQWYLKHKEESIVKMKHWEQNNKEKRRLQRKRWERKNGKRLIAYRERNKRRVELYSKEQITQRKSKLALYQRNRRAKDPLYKLTNRIRNLINNIFRNGGYVNSSHAYEYLCCTYEEFYRYLGQKPSPYHQLDHICPNAQAKNEEELIKLQHYSNFQWLHKDDNLAKLHHITPEGEELCRQLLGREWIY